MLIFSGFAFVTSALGIFVLAIVSVLMYLIVTPLEERELRQQYGSEYEAYCLAVPRFIPGCGRGWFRKSGSRCRVSGLTVEL